MQQIDVPPSHRRGTVAAIVESPWGSLIVYGTVMAWANEKTFDDGRPARMWEVHRAEVERQVDEWRQIRRTYPDLPFLVAGDFNQDRDGSGWYGDQRARTLVTEALGAIDTSCVTEMDVVKAGWLQTHHLVDHICISADLARNHTVTVHEHHDGHGQRLSDHPTVTVDFHFLTP